MLQHALQSRVQNDDMHCMENLCKANQITKPVLLTTPYSRSHALVHFPIINKNILPTDENNKVNIIEKQWHHTMEIM